MPGLDNAVLAAVDSNLAIRRVLADVRSDFILAPHYSAIYGNVGGDLWGALSELLRNGKLDFSLPITIDVPKRSGLTRPGSILPPYDRLLYQVLVDLVAPQAEQELSRSDVFSHVLQSPDPTGVMFRSSSESWQLFQTRVQQLCDNEQFEYVVKADVASFFERLYQHNLINLLQSAGCSPSAVNLLEKALSAWMEKDSHGILQGMFPSDYFGTFYLHGLDSYLQTQDVPFARYVDDIFAFFPSDLDARRGLAEICRVLRHEGLNLNESKSGIWTTQHVLYEETELDRMFSEARQEVSGHLESDWYNFQVMWMPVDDSDEKDDEIAATEALFDSILRADVTESQYDKIERFAIPLLGAARSESAVDHCIEQFTLRPHMAMIYGSYLGALARENEAVATRVSELIEVTELAHDWQAMWLVGALLAAQEVRTRVINHLGRLLADGNRHPALRGVCALVIGKHGNAGQRRMLRHRYADEPSDYVRSAILFSSRYFPAAERRTALAAWGGHSMTNLLVANAVRTLVA